MIDAYVHSISQIADLRMDERSHEPCIMYVNGEYWGVYDVREKVDDIDFTDPDFVTAQEACQDILAGFRGPGQGGGGRPGGQG